MTAYSTNGNGTDWATAGNWSPGDGPPNGSGDSVTIDHPMTSPNDVTIGDVNLNDPLTLGTDAGKMTINGNLTQVAGSILGGADRDMDINGTWTVVGCPEINMGTMTMAGGILSILAPTAVTAMVLVMDNTAAGRSTAWPWAAIPIPDLRIIGSGGSCIRVDDVYCKKLTVDSGSTFSTSAAKDIYLAPTGNNFCDIQGSVEGNGAGTLFTVTLTSALSNSGRIHAASNIEKVIINSSNDILTQSGEVSIETILEIYDSGVAKTTLNLNAPYSYIKTVDFGDGANATGALGVSGTLRCDSIRRKSGATVADNELNLNSSLIELLGTIDGTDITVTADAGGCHIVGVGGGAKAIDDFQPDNQVHSHECTLGGTTADTSDDTEVYPGSLALMGVGV